MTPPHIYNILAAAFESKSVLGIEAILSSGEEAKFNALQISRKEDLFLIDKILEGKSPEELGKIIS